MKTLPLIEDCMHTGEASDNARDGEDAALADAQYILEAVHGPGAPPVARAIAFERLSEGGIGECLFWLRVHHLLVTEPSAPEVSVLH